MARQTFTAVPLPVCSMRPRLLLVRPADAISRSVESDLERAVKALVALERKRRGISAAAAAKIVAARLWSQSRDDLADAAE